MKVFYDKQAVGDLDKAVALYGDKEFRSPYRSTVPSLSWLKHARPMVASVFNALGMPTDSNLHLEYTVKPPCGRGTASHTDLMVLSGDNGLSIMHLLVKW